MKLPAHMITLSSAWRGLSLGERIALEGASAMLWPLHQDQRMTVAINLLAAEIDQVEGDDAVDAIIDMLRMQLKLGRRQPSPPLQP